MVVSQNRQRIEVTEQTFILKFGERQTQNCSSWDQLTQKRSHWNHRGAGTHKWQLWWIAMATCRWAYSEKPTHCGTTVLGSCSHFHAFHLQKHHQVLWWRTMKNLHVSPSGEEEEEPVWSISEYSPNKDLHWIQRKYIVRASSHKLRGWLPNSSASSLAVIR